MNACLNARDAMTNGGHLTLESENAVLAGDAAKRFVVEPWEYVLLRIMDTVCGMGLKTQKRIFELYFATKGDRNGNVLGLVVDEEVIHRMGKRMLKKFGYRVLIAANGEEAVRIAGNPEERIDLLIVDKVMPRLDGSETLKRIREIRSAIKALLTSGYVLSDPEAPGRDGALGFLPKPFMLDQMLQLILQSLHGKVVRMKE